MEHRQQEYSKQDMLAYSVVESVFQLVSLPLISSIQLTLTITHVPEILGRTGILPCPAGKDKEYYR